MKIGVALLSDPILNPPFCSPCHLAIEMIRCGWAQRLGRRWAGDVAVAKGGEPSTAVSKPAPPRPATEASHAPAAKAGKPGSRAGSWQERLGYFATGVAVTAAFGYARLREDIWASSARIDDAVSAIDARVKALERKLRTNGSHQQHHESVSDASS